MKWLMCTALFALSLNLAAAEERRVVLTTLEWPPYVGAALPAQGAVAAVAKAAFAAMGYHLEIEFFPWARAVQIARNNPKYAGYFPEYYAKDNAREFLYSPPIGTSLLGFVERRDAPVHWTDLDDLKHLVIGTVKGYFNTEAFDALAARGELKVEEAVDDRTNLIKVATRRLPLAVIDREVMRYLLASSPSLTGFGELLAFNDKPLATNKLYICFKRGPEGERLAKILEAGLARIDPARVLADYLAELFGDF